MKPVKPNTGTASKGSATRADAPATKPSSAAGAKATQKLRRRPNWVVWRGRSTVSLYSAICLIHNITPGHDYVNELREAGDSRCKHFDGHLITLKQSQPLDERLRAVPPFGPKLTDRTFISLRGFIDFVRKHDPFPGVTIPKEFWALEPPLLSAPATANPFSQRDTAVPPGKRAEAATPHSPMTVPPQSPAAPVTASAAKEPSPAPRSSPASVPKLKSNPTAASRSIELDGPGFLSLTDVLAVMSVKRSTWYSGMKKGIYPRPVPLVEGGRRVGWRKADINDLVDGLAK